MFPECAHGDLPQVPGVEICPFAFHWLGGKIKRKISFFKIGRLCKNNASRFGRWLKASNHLHVGTGGNCRCSSLRDFYVKVALDI